MSNAGKTTLAQKLTKYGFRYFSCDDFIAKKLYPNGIEVNEINNWLGYPFMKKYQERANEYLLYEHKSLEKAISIIKDDVSNLIIDTTGSVIYHKQSLLASIKNKSLVIHLTVDKSHIDALYKNYLQYPKPVIWGNSFHNLDPDPKKSLKKCYPRLLKFRLAKYKSFAHININNKKLLSDPSIIFNYSKYEI